LCATHIAYEIMKKILFLIAIVLGLYAYDTFSSSDSDGSYSSGNTEESSGDGAGSGTQASATQMVRCPMCGGTGIYEFMPGDVVAPRVTCSGCSGSGAVTPEVAQKLVNGKAQVDAMMGGGGSSYGTGGSGKSAAQLELELKKACETLAGMEYNRDMCSSVTLRAQYDRMIAEQKQRIEELRTQYYKASY